MSSFSIKSEEGAFTVFRDSEPLATPRNLPVKVPGEALAEAIAEECKRQGDKLDLRTMPLTQMALTALDITAPHREEVIDGIMRHGENELICQRATEPAELAEEQDKLWQPYIDWCEATFKIKLNKGKGILPFEQDAEALETLRSYIENFDQFYLTGISESVGIIGSLVLGLAFVKGYADADKIIHAAELDHLWQNKKWGEDPTLKARHAEVKRELEMCGRWLSLLGGLTDSPRT